MPSGRTHRAPRGLTLVELTVAIAIISVVFGGAVMGIGALTGARARSATGELAALMRSLYDTAALSGKTCRIAFELPGRDDAGAPVTYRAECAEGAVTMSRDREAALEEATRQREREREDGARGRERPRTLTSGDDEPTLEELMAREEERVQSAARFSEYTNEEVQPKPLPAGVTVEVWTRAQREPVSAGVAYVYFFPQGTAEKAMVFLTQGDNTWTIDVSPLTGKTQVYGERREPPRS